MNLFRKIALTITITLFSIHSYGQGYIHYDYISTSILKDDLEGQYGSGNMQIIQCGYDIPLSTKYNAKQQPAIWTANVRLAYGALNNYGQATELNPNDIFNGSLNITHIRPLSDKWDFIASIGGGIYAPTNEISSKSVLANGGFIFLFKLNKNLSLGAGAGIANSYGAPMFVPMLIISWHKRGKYEFQIDMSNSLKVASSIRCNKTIKLELTDLEVDGMSAVRSNNGKSVIYSTVMLNSYVRPSVNISKHLEIFAGVGGNWIRGIKTSEREIKGFFDVFKEDKGEDKLRFDVALRFFTGLNFKF